MKQTANMRKNATSFRPKKHQHENTSEASDFLCTRFQMSTKHLEPVMTIRNQYMFPGGRKKGHQQPLSQENARINQVIFHQIADSRFFLINPRTITFARTIISKNQTKKFSVLESRPLKSLKKKIFSSKFPHMAQIFIFQIH